jgi:hypothetical protein
MLASCSCEQYSICNSSTLRASATDGWPSPSSIQFASGACTPCFQAPQQTRQAAVCTLLQTHLPVRTSSCKVSRVEPQMPGPGQAPEAQNGEKQRQTSISSRLVRQSLSVCCDVGRICCAGTKPWTCYIQHVIAVLYISYTNGGSLC